MKKKLEDFELRFKNSVLCGIELNDKFNSAF